MKIKGLEKYKVSVKKAILGTKERALAPVLVKIKDVDERKRVVNILLFNRSLFEDVAHSKQIEVTVEPL